MKIAIIGCGPMGRSFAKSLSEKTDVELILCDIDAKRLSETVQEVGGSSTADAFEAIDRADLILLNIGPHDLESFKKPCKYAKKKILVSHLPSVSSQMLSQHFPGAVIVRSMVNLGFASGNGVIAFVDSDDATDEIKSTLERVHEGMGKVYWIEESQFDGVMALTGPGTAFVLTIIESMVEAGIGMGLQADLGKALALQTLCGAVALAKDHHGHPGELRWQIASPGGTTIAGQKAFEEAGVRGGILDAFEASFKRLKEIREEI